MPSLAAFAKSKIKKVLRKKRAQILGEPPPEDLEMEPAAPPTKGTYELDESLEAAAAPSRPPLNGGIGKVMRKSGLLSMIRNRGNQQLVDPEDQGNL